MFVYGTFAEEADAADAVRSLMNAGFDSRYIGALMRTDEGLTEVPMSIESGVKRGAVLGAAIGAAGGALLMPSPGILAAGPLLAAVEGAVGGGALGTFHGGFFGLFANTKVDFDADDAEASTILLGVNADERQALARDILEQHRAYRLHVRKEPLGTESGPVPATPGSEA